MTWKQDDEARDDFVARHALTELAADDRGIMVCENHLANMPVAPVLNPFIIWLVNNDDPNFPVKGYGTSAADWEEAIRTARGMAVVSGWWTEVENLGDLSDV